MQIHELSTFSGTPTTSDYLVIDDGSETTKLPATTLVDMFYPVGSYYETSDISFNPNNVWGGTWVLETAGQVHVSAGTGYTVSGALTNTSDGGEKTHKLTTGEMAAHTHGNKSLTGAMQIRKVANGAQGTYANGICSVSNGSSNWATAQLTSTSVTFDVVNIDASHEHNSVGSGTAHNNMQPYIVVRRWHRTA